PTWPACHFVKKFCTRFVYAEPEAMIGEVPECGFAKIFRNVANFASGLISGDVSEAFVVGTLRMSFENCARKWLFVVRYLTSAHDWSRCFAPRGMPMIVPLM